MARDAGRNLETLSVTLFNPAEDEGELARYRDMGVARVVPMLPRKRRQDPVDPRPPGRADPPHLALILSRSLHPRPAGK